MIERAIYIIALPLTNAERKRAYRDRLNGSHQFDEHEHALRVARGLRTMHRLHAYWQLFGSVQKWTEADERRARPVLTLATRKRA